MKRLKLLLLDDNAEFARALRRRLDSQFAIQHVGTIEEARLANFQDFDIALVDIVLDKDNSTRDRSGLDFVRWAHQHHPEMPLIVLTGYGADELEIEAMRCGAADYIEKDSRRLRLLAPKVTALMERKALRQETARLASRLETYEPHLLIGSSAVIERLRSQIGKFAASDATVFVQGESGVGKEVVARAIHKRSPRSRKPFVAVNCAALSAGILESELFGHEKGAFTGAERKRVGMFEVADGGTLLLDEITEVDPGVQATLLRVLQDREIQPVGSSRTRDVDTRVIATTNRDVRQAVREKRLREDLFFRLNVLPLGVPPLRQHLEDIPELVEHFLREIKCRVPSSATTFSKEALLRLESYRWPGNIRELRNIVERAVTVCDRKTVPAELVAGWIADGPIAEPDSLSEDLNMGRQTALAQLKTLVAALEQTDGVKKEAQKLLGFQDRSTMRRTVLRLRQEFPDLWERFPALNRLYPS